MQSQKPFKLLSTSKVVEAYHFCWGKLFDRNYHLVSFSIMPLSNRTLILHPSMFRTGVLVRWSPWTCTSHRLCFSWTHSGRCSCHRGTYCSPGTVKATRPRYRFAIRGFRRKFLLDLRCYPPGTLWEDGSTRLVFPSTSWGDQGICRSGWTLRDTRVCGPGCWCDKTEYLRDRTQ